MPAALQVTTALEDTGLDDHEEEQDGAVNGADDSLPDQKVVAKFLVRAAVRLMQQLACTHPSPQALSQARWSMSLWHKSGHRDLLAYPLECCCADQQCRCRQRHWQGRQQHLR